MLDLVFQNLTSDPPSSRLRRASKKYTSKFFEKILTACIGELKLGKKRIEISVNLVGEGKIKELNNKYRKKNKVTDVLSFPMSEKLEIGNWKLEIPKSNALAFDLGDLFICLSFAKNEAKRENIDIERKLAQLTVHGFLHLLGYDHEASKQEANRMFKLEERILSRIKNF